MVQQLRAVVVLVPCTKRSERIQVLNSPGNGAPERARECIKAPNSWVLWNVMPKSDNNAFHIFSAAC
jgi:hypothetical protein